MGSDNGDSPVIIVQQNPDEVNHTVKISNLEPSTDYYICITSHNGVSDQDKATKNLGKLNFMQVHLRVVSEVYISLTNDKYNNLRMSSF